MNPLAGKPLRYLIGADADKIPTGRLGEIIEVPYDCDKVPPVGLAIGYCNLFDEENSGRFPPYMSKSDTAREYNEGQIDPKGPGFSRNICAQLERRRASGFRYVELDNPDAYRLTDNLRAIALAEQYKLGVIAKNPGLGCNGDPADQIVAHQNVFGIIVENGAGTADSMEALRVKCGRPLLPCWFVFFGSDMRARAMKRAHAAKGYSNMGVTLSTRGEYGNCFDLCVPATA